MPTKDLYFIAALVTTAKILGRLRCRKAGKQIRAYLYNGKVLSRKEGPTHTWMDPCYLTPSEGRSTRKGTVSMLRVYETPGMTKLI